MSAMDYTQVGFLVVVVAIGLGGFIWVAMKDEE